MKRPALILTRKRVVHFTLERSNTGVGVTVQGQGMTGALGPRARAHLTAGSPPGKKR